MQACGFSQEIRASLQPTKLVKDAIRRAGTDIRDKAGPQTRAEKRLARLIKLPLLLCVLGVPLVSSWALKRENPEGATFLVLCLNASGVVFTFNVVDLLLDCVLVRLNPRFVVIPGTEGMAGYKDYAHHCRGFLVGTAGSVVCGLLISAAVFFLCGVLVLGYRRDAGEVRNDYAPAGASAGL